MQEISVQVVSFFCKNYTKLPQILCSFLKQHEYFQPFKSNLNTFNTQGECTRTIFKQSKSYSAVFHGFIAWDIDSIQKIFGEHTIYAWGSVTRMVKWFIGALLIHIKRVLSMVPQGTFLCHLVPTIGALSKL